MSKRREVINSVKMEEGEFLPSKDIPDVLDDGQVMTVYWTVLGKKVYTFVALEDLLGDQQPYSGLAELSGSKPHIFKLYGVIHGKVYPWQMELAALDESRLLRTCKARSGAEAECREGRRGHAEHPRRRQRWSHPNG